MPFPTGIILHLGILIGILIMFLFDRWFFEPLREKMIEDIKKFVLKGYE